MLNIICGAGVIGKATGAFLEANGEEVFYVDTDYEVIEKLKKQGKQASDIPPSQYDIFWICTHEKYALDLIPHIMRPKDDQLAGMCGSTITIIRSTISPEMTDKIDLEYVLHMPEFLVEAAPLEGTFFPDRVIIGTKYPESPHTDFFANYIAPFYEKEIKIFPMKVSSLIKLYSNAWLTTQIAFWNEVYHTMSDDVKPFRQMIANIVALDERISEYGTKMLGTHWSGKCFPKDLDHIIKYTDSILFKIIKERNDEWKTVQ